MFLLEDFQQNQVTKGVATKGFRSWRPADATSAVMAPCYSFISVLREDRSDDVGHRDYPGDRVCTSPIHLISKVQEKWLPGCSGSINTEEASFNLFCIYSLVFHILTTVSPPSFPPSTHHPHPLLFHFCSEKGRSSMAINQTWHVKLQ